MAALIVGTATTLSSKQLSMTDETLVESRNTSLEVSVGADRPALTRQVTRRNNDYLHNDRYQWVGRRWR